MASGNSWFLMPCLYCFHTKKQTIRHVQQFIHWLIQCISCKIGTRFVVLCLGLLTSSICMMYLAMCFRLRILFHWDWEIWDREIWVNWLGYRRNILCKALNCVYIYWVGLYCMKWVYSRKLCGTKIQIMCMYVAVKSFGGSKCKNS